MKWLAEFPSTNARIFVTICLAIGYVAAAITASWRGHPLSDGTLYGVGAFLTVWAGLDVTQFAVKRNTYAPSPPAPPDVEDRAASQPDGGPVVSALRERYQLPAIRAFTEGQVRENGDGDEHAPHRTAVAIGATEADA